MGKVGKVGSVRTLGSDRKPSELEEEGETVQNSADANGAASQMTAAGGNLNPQSTQQYQQQQYNMGYYHQQQQHASTGQMPYYGTTATSATGSSYPDYMYGYSQDPYNQQAAWQAWQQQQVGW